MKPKEILTYTKAMKQAPPLSRAAGTVNGASIDRRGYEKALVVILPGVLAGGDTLNVDVYDDSATAFPSETLYADIATVADTEDDKVLVAEIDLRNAEEWIRLKMVSAGAAAIWATMVVLYNPEGLEIPVTQQNTPLVVTLA